MGLPQILIQFKTLAETMITRSGRGVAAVIVRDNTSVFDSMTYVKETEIDKSHYTASNLSYLSQLFMGSPSKVIVERVSTADTLDAALLRLKNKKWNFLLIDLINKSMLSVDPA